MAVPFKFTEQTDQTYYHDIKVYVCGVDVTPWLTGDVSINYGEGAGINVLNLTLSNQQDAFVLTEKNLTEKEPSKAFRNLDPYSPSGDYSERAKMEIWNKKNADGRNIKHGVNTFGPNGAVTGVVLGNTNDEGSSLADTTRRYPFSPGSLVFHKFDQVRVFVKNPLTRNSQWMVAFSGFLDVKPYTRDRVGGMSTIRLTAQDIRFPMQRMRTQTNPSAAVGNQNTIVYVGKNGTVPGDKPDAGYFNDLIAPNQQYNHVLGAQTFKDSLYFLIFGGKPVRAYSKVGVNDIPPDNGGIPKGQAAVGKMTVGYECNYDPSTNVKDGTLESWNNIIHFGSKEGGFLTTAEMLKIGSQTSEWGTEDLWARKVHFMWPADGAPNTNLVEYGVATSVTDKIAWASRLELILDICQNIDYKMYVSPWGDIVFEFPMWDFNPGNFGPVYAECYKFDLHVISEDINDEGGDAVTAVTATSNYLNTDIRGGSEDSSQTQGYETAGQLVRTAYSNSLASRIGVQVKTISKPGITDPSALARFALLELNKAIADYSKFDFKTQYRPFISINRPIHNVRAYRIGGVTSFTTTWRLRDTVELDINLNCIRRAEINDGKLTFKTVTGGEASPLSYNKMYTAEGVRGQGASVTANKDKE